VRLHRFKIREVQIRFLFLKANLGPILSSRRSVTRGLGLKVGVSSLRSAKIFDRELFYLSLPEERALPRPRTERVEGWTSVSRYRYTEAEQSAWLALYQSACVDSCWKPASTFTGTALDDIQSGCFIYGLPTGNKYRSMLGMSRSQCYRWARSSRDESIFGRCKFKKKGEEIWVLKDCQYTSKRILCPRFSSRGVPWAGNRELSARASGLLPSPTVGVNLLDRFFTSAGRTLRLRV